MDLNTIDTSASSTHTETYTQPDLILDKSSHNNIFSHFNNRDNNTINTIHRDRYIYGNISKNGKGMIITINTIGNSDDYTQVDYTTDTSRHNNISRTNNTDNNKLIYLNAGGTNTAYTQGGHILDNNHNFRYYNTIGNGITSDNYTQGNYVNDMGRHITTCYNDNTDFFFEKS